jgi:hypothetical protein
LAIGGSLFLFSSYFILSSPSTIFIRTNPKMLFVILAILAIGASLGSIDAQKTTPTPHPSTLHPTTFRPSTFRPTRPSKFTTPSMTTGHPSPGRPTRPSKFTTSASMTTSPPQWTDPNAGGRNGNPGARLRISNKTVDVLHSYVADLIARSIQSMALPEFNVSIGTGLLTVKTPRISEAKFANVDYDLVPSNRIRSHFYGGRIVASGAWRYKAIAGRDAPSWMGSELNGVYRATVVNADLNATTQLGRGADAKPIAQLTDCKPYLGQFRIDIQGAGNLTTIENCDDPICNKIRGFFEDAVCVIVRTIVKEVINAKLSTFPSRVTVFGENNKLDYGLLYNEPKVADSHIQCGLEGKAIWRNSNYVPFSPNPLNFVDKKRMLTFELSDYTFNTLLHQANSQGRFSAAQSLSHSSAIQQQLALNCTTAPPPVETRKRFRYRAKALPVRVSQCLGSLFENVTAVEEYSSNVTGDLVYKSNRGAPSVFIHSAERAFFDGSNGVLEVYGPAVGQNDQRMLLGRAEIRVLRGEFTPNFTNKNFTGAIKITTLQLDKASFGSTQSKPTSEDWLIKLTQFATPILTEMFNTFFNRLAQFPIPLLDGFECTSPEFLVSARTMQVDCDIRAI